MAVCKCFFLSYHNETVPKVNVRQPIFVLGIKCSKSIIVSLWDTHN